MREVTHQHRLHLPNQKFAPLLIQNNSKKKGQHGKYTPEQKAMIGKRAAVHGVVANLCIPDCFILGNLVPKLLTSKLEAIALCVHEGCG